MYLISGSPKLHVKRVECLNASWVKYYDLYLYSTQLRVLAHTAENAETLFLRICGLTIEHLLTNQSRILADNKRFPDGTYVLFCPDSVVFKRINELLVRMPLESMKTSIVNFCQFIDTLKPTDRVFFEKMGFDWINDNNLTCNGELD